jgi:hypothetical protein
MFFFPKQLQAMGKSLYPGEVFIELELSGRRLFGRIYLKL